MKITKKYESCNHHHELTDEQRVIDLGTGEFVADIQMITLLKALNSAGLITRTHCHGHKTGHSFVSILLDDVQLEVRDVNEKPDREFVRGKKELLIMWKRKD
jgi:hypothetical protein